MAKAPADFFADNLAYARNLVAIARAVDAQTTSVVDVTDILRAALVAGVSALDHYVHEKVRTRMLEAHASGAAVTDAFGRFRVSLASARAGLSNPGTAEWLDAEIRSQHSLLSFQKPDKIADAVRLISSIKLWEDVAAQLGITDKDMKRELILIIDRRNKIAHEADVDPTPPHDRWPISYADVERALDFLELNVGAIDCLC